ncbi:MAG: hypothetical protein E7774_10075 [Bradyrhizobium sp.]|nr:MAG: hypothetical protein E7774_10075 [Bradyrhizobium sp.]
MTEPAAQPKPAKPSDAPNCLRDAGTRHGVGPTAGLRHLIAPSIWPLADQAMVSAANFLITALIARGLGVYEFGLFTLAWAVVLFAGAVQYTLVSAPMFTMAPRHDRAAQAGYFGALAMQGVAFAALASVVILAGARAGALVFKDWPLSPYAFALAAAAVAYLAQEFVRRCLFARGRQRVALVSDTICYLGQIALLLVAFRYGVQLEGVLWICTLTFALAAAAGLAAIGSVEFRARQFCEALRQHWSFSLWLLASMLAQWVWSYTLLLASGAMLGVAAVGGMRAAWLVLAINNVLLLGQQNFLPTRAAEVLHRDGRPAFKSLMQRWTLLGLGITLAISLIAVAAPAFWIKLFCGEAMLPYANLVYGYAISFPLAYASAMAGVFLRTDDATQRIFKASMVMTALGVASAYPLIATLGIWGAVTGTILCQIAGLAVMTSGATWMFARPSVVAQYNLPAASIVGERAVPPPSGSLRPEQPTVEGPSGRPTILS